MSVDREQNQASYESVSEGDGRVRFRITPAPVPNLLFLYLTLGFLFAMLGGIITSAVGLSLLGIVGGGIGGFMFGKWFWRRNVDKRRAPGGEFVAGPTGLHVNGQTIERDRIHQLTIRNGMDLAQQTNVAMDRTGAQRAANVARAAQVSYMLVAEAGGRATTLAGGMTETCAAGLRADVLKAVG